MVYNSGEKRLSQGHMQLFFLWYLCSLTNYLKFTQIVNSYLEDHLKLQVMKLNLDTRMMQAKNKCKSLIYTYFKNSVTNYLLFLLCMCSSTHLIFCIFNLKRPLNA